MWSFTLHETITGERLNVVNVNSGSWGRSPGAGSGSHVVQLRDAGFPVSRSVARQLAEPNKVSLAVAWNGVVLYAGVVIDGLYSRDDATVTVQHVDVRSLMKQRGTFGVTTYPDGDLMLRGKSLSGLVAGIVSRGVYWWGDTWRLPVDLPADTSGGNQMLVNKWEWVTIEELLVRVEKLGAVIDFDPYYDANGWLRWRVRVGTPRLPGTSFEWVATAEETPVSKLTVRHDGAKQITGCFYMGKGTEADMRFGEAGFIGGPRIPVRDATRSAKDESNVAALNQMALTDLQANRSPTVEWAFDLVADGSWSPAGLKPGARITLWSSGDPFILDGSNSLVVTGVSGDMSYVLQPEVMPL